MSKTKKIRNLLIAVFALLLIGVGLYYVPPIHQRLSWRIDNLQTIIYYFFNPPQEVVFVPNPQDQPTVTPRPTSTPTIEPTISLTPTSTAIPIPQSVILENVTFIDQMHRWNYCGPANLTMALKYVGWDGTRDDVGGVVKPGVNDPSLDFVQRSQTDVNVMPYEMVDFVNDNTPYRALYRYGGDIDLIKRLIAAGFPVIVEKGIYQTLPPEQTMQWAGHYSFTTGYDDSAGEFIWQDSYTPDENIPYEQQGHNVRMSYEEYVEGWRAFNYVFIVVYAPEREVELYQVLGTWADEAWAASNALAIAEAESQTLTGIDLFFAWYNKGTSYGLQTEYGQAAMAFDNAFNLYNALPADDRPFRIMWYQTGPYRAYYYTSRYEDVIELADNTESTLYSPTGVPRALEETMYWRGLAEAALGYYDAAYADMRKAVEYNPNFGPGLTKLAEWGISP